MKIKNQELRIAVESIVVEKTISPNRLEDRAPMEPILHCEAEGREPEKPMFSFHEDCVFLWKLKDFVQPECPEMLATASRPLPGCPEVVKTAARRLPGCPDAVALSSAALSGSPEVVKTASRPMPGRPDVVKTAA